MQTKSQFILYIIVVFTVITIIIGCIYEERATKRTIEISESIIEENKRTIETETYEEVDTNQAVQPVSLGSFKLTAYCSCSICCGKWANNRPVDEDGNEIVYGAIGERLKEGYSIAVDPNVIDYNSKVMINEKIYEAQDCGGGIKGKEIDIYFEDHDDALEFGVQHTEVFVEM